MTVKELWDLLNAEDPDAEVWIEGCDCLGKASGVASTMLDYRTGEPRPNAILITRGDEDP